MLRKGHDGLYNAPTITLCEVYPNLQRYGHGGQRHSNYPFVAKYCVIISVIFVSLHLVHGLGLLCIFMLPLLFYCNCLSL